MIRTGVVDRGLNGTADIATRPSATSLAYVMFTSGSTGKPKGVMVEHRGIVREVKENNVMAKLQPGVRIAHLSNLAFDATTWEIHAALLNGGTVVCIDYFTTLDSKALEAVFVRERVTAAMLAPALLKQCLANMPATLGKLEVLYIGGDRLDTHDTIEAQTLMQTGSVYNSYGPTENTISSTIYKVIGNEYFVNGVPLGRALSNSGAYIMDIKQQLVSTGVMGELAVTGDGLARGYTNPALNQDRFIQITIEGRLVRAYRTGDRVRYRPKDGQIEFFGRMDQQIKIRGHRIEPAEVENAMLSHSLVGDAAIVIRTQEGREPEIIGYVTVQDKNSH